MHIWLLQTFKCDVGSLNTCKIKKVIILKGRVRKIQLTNFSNLKDAAEAYVNYCKEYKCTPLKVELLRALLEAKENELFEMAVKATESVYGTASTNLSVIAALAEQGMEKSLRSFLLVSYYVHWNFHTTLKSLIYYSNISFD